MTFSRLCSLVLMSMSVLSFVSRAALAQICCPAGADCHLAPGWAAPQTLDLEVAATGSAPSADTAFNPAGLAAGRTYAVTGTRLTAFNNADGTRIFSLNLSGNTLENFPNPVILTPDCNGGVNCSPGDRTTLFLGGDDGFLYKVAIDPANPANPTVTPVNLQRPGCTNDKIMGTPAVQLYRFSNVAFQSAIDAGGMHARNDLVIVGTFYPDQGGACPGGQNRVYGLFAGDLSPKWVFNTTGALVLDPVAEACSLEYYSGVPPPGTFNNTALCGFSKTGPNNGLMAFDTAAGPAGSPRWAADTVGSVLVRPIIATLNGRRAVYVGTSDGQLRAYSPTNGTPLWTNGVPVLPAGITQNIWAEFRGGPFQNRIFVVDAAGVFHRFLDLGTSGVEEGMGLAAEGAVKYVSMPVMAPSLGTLYLGRNDGQVQQISSAYMPQEVQFVGGSMANVFDPSLDLSALDGTPTNLIVTAGASGATPGKVARFTIPFCPIPPGG